MNCGSSGSSGCGGRSSSGRWVWVSSGCGGSPSRGC